ncbi:MAG: FAD-dependent oxidoreductase, partial [Dehalococcoidia bacterium]|nr:FAD-dependent oxidoreductase [Dehalococcoidia bacterium]
MEERDVIIIGAGPAGLSAAIFTKLDGWNTLVLECNWVGGQAAIASTVSNYPGFLPGDGAILVEHLEKQATLSPPQGVGAELKHENVVNINADERIVITETAQYKGKVIIIATGSTMQKLGISGEDEFIRKGVSYYAKRDAGQFAGKRILVVGGGNSTAKSALVAKSAGAAWVGLAHRREALRAYPNMIKKLEKEGVDILYSTEVREIRGHHQVDSVLIINNKNGDKKEIAVDWVVICVGTEPNIRVARESGLGINGSYIMVNEKMMASKQGVFACGEVISADRHLISCTASGALAGISASEYLALE